MKVKIGNIAQLINGDRGKNYPSQSDITDEGDIPFVNAGHLQEGIICFDEMNYITEEKYNCLNSGKFIENDILYCLRGSLGKKAIVRDSIQGAIASSLVIIRANTEIACPDYLMFALDSPSIIQQLKQANNGSSQPNLSAESVRNYIIDLPEIEAQRAIVAKLAKVKSIIDNRKKELQNFETLIKARFVEMFGDPVCNPKGWKKQKLVDVCIKLTDGTHFSPESFEKGDYKYVTAKNIKPSGFDFTNITYVPKSVHRPIYARCNPERGDVLYIKDGVTTGIAMVNTLDEEFTMLSSVALLKQNRTIINGYFLCCVLNNNEMYNRIRGNMGGAAITRLTIAKLNEIKIIVPPIELQEQFATFIAQIDKSRVIVEKALEKTKVLYDSLMQDYFG